MFRHDTTHTGASTTTAPEAADILWTYQTDFIISSSPAVSHGRVYIGAWDRSLYCLEMDSGTVLWNYSTNSEITSSPAVVNGRVFFGSQDTYLYCLDAVNGSLLWVFKTGFIIDTSPLVVDEQVFFGSSDGSLYSLNVADGSLLWEYETNSAFVSSPAIADGRLYTGIVNGDFVCLNSLTGELLWVFVTTSGIYSSPTIDDGKVYFGANDNNVYCLNAQTGGILWSYDAGCEVHASPSVAYGCVYIGTSDGRMLCLDKETGGFLWSYLVNGSVESSPGIADGKLYFDSDPCCGYTSYLVCLNAYSGALIWSYNFNTQFPTKSSPALAAGKLFVGSGDGTIYAFGDIQYLADANGPYYGFEDSPVQFTGSVYGGDPGFSWFWDFGDGTTSPLQNPTHTYTSVGEYPVSLTVIDNLGQIATDGTQVFIEVPNIPPQIPLIEGPTSGKPGVSYEFVFTTTDQNDDKILYFIDWGDNTTSGWLGPFAGDEAVHLNHTWANRGTYEILVKAKDWHGAESTWSEPFTLSIIAPVLSLDVTGGLGFTVSITNRGDAPATIIQWNTSFEGGTLFHVFITQPTETIPPGLTKSVRITPVGFGSMTLNLFIGCDEGITYNTTVPAKLFLVFVFGIHPL
jgi:outer membrane protein assembly factor BamB